MPFPIDFMPVFKSSGKLFPQNPPIGKCFLIKPSWFGILKIMPPIAFQAEVIDHHTFSLRSPALLLFQIIREGKFLESAILHARNGLCNPFRRTIEVELPLAFENPASIPSRAVPPEGERLEIRSTRDCRPTVVVVVGRLLHPLKLLPMFVAYQFLLVLCFTMLCLDERLKIGSLIPLPFVIPIVKVPNPPFHFLADDFFHGIHATILCGEVNQMLSLGRQVAS